MSARVRGPAKPKPPIAVAPLAVSTESCFAVAGIPPRRLREALAQHPDVPRSRIGKLVIVRAADFIELLDRLEADPSTEVDAPASELEDDDVGAVGDVLARAGLRRGTP